MKMRMASLMLVVLAVASGCNAGRVFLPDGSVVQGDGSRGSRQVTVPSDFTELVIEGGFLSSVVLVPGGTELRLEGENVFLPYFQASADGGTLTIGFDQTVGYGRDGTSALEARVPVSTALQSVKALTSGIAIAGNGLRGEALRVEVGGSGELSLTDLDYRSLSLKAGPQANVVLSGKVDEATIRLDHQARLQAAGLQVRRVTLSANGERQVTVNPTEPIVEVEFEPDHEGGAPDAGP